MTGSAHHVIHHLGDRGPAFWLPPAGWGNRLRDDSWAPLVDVSSEVAANLILLAFLEAGVPGYAARVKPPGRASVRLGYREVHRVRIWVGCSAYGRAETTLMHLVPTLVKRLGDHVIA